MPLDDVTLIGNHVRVEPLTADHVDALVAAATESRESYGFTWVPADGEGMRSFVAEALAERAAGREIPLAVRDLSRDVVVGSTRLFDFGWWYGRDAPDAVEIGHTWYAASAQRTACNTETKLLLLTHVFESWQVVRATLKTDARNVRSRAAIERIGGRFEGIRRAHKLASDGSVRDTAYYSIVAAEWPDVRRRLRERLARVSTRR